MTFPDESICFIFSTRRARVSSFLAPEYQTTNSFLWLNARRFVSVRGSTRLTTSWLHVACSAASTALRNTRCQIGRCKSGKNRFLTGRLSAGRWKATDNRRGGLSLEPQRDIR